MRPYNTNVEGGHVFFFKLIFNINAATWVRLLFVPYLNQPLKDNREVTKFASGVYKEGKKNRRSGVLILREGKL